MYLFFATLISQPTRATPVISVAPFYKSAASNSSIFFDRTEAVLTMKEKARLLWLGIGILTLSFAVARSQTPQQLIQQVVDTERTANRNDHSHWIYLQEMRKPKEHILQWVAGTPQGDVRRVLEKDDQKPPEPQQRDQIQKFVHDTRAQNKEISESNHDNQQIDDFLKLLPAAFVWTQTRATPTNTSLHFEPNPDFHPPTREARVSAAWRATSSSITSNTASAA